MEKSAQAKLKKKKITGDQWQKITVLGLIVVVCIMFAILKPDAFLTVENAMNILLQMSVVCIMSFGMTIIIINAGVDLSMGVIIAFTGVVAALYIKGGKEGDSLGNIYIGVLLGVLAGAAIGFINGTVVARFGLAPYIATLGMQMTLKGVTYLISSNSPIYVSPTSDFRLIAQQRLFGVIPFPILYTIVFGSIASFILKKTVIGRHIFAIGSNDEAARLSGINLPVVRTIAYTLGSTFAALAGVLYAARVNSGNPTAGAGYEGNAVVATVLGGTSMAGGHGSISAAVIGAILMTLLQNGFNLLNISTNYQMILIGVVLIISVIIDRIRREKAMS